MDPLEHFRDALNSWEIGLIERVAEAQITMVSIPKMVDTVLAARHVVEQNVPGQFVEAGVWRGGISILAKIVFEKLGSDKEVWLYDTFQGMTEPSPADVGLTTGEVARDTYFRKQTDSHNDWCFADLREVKENCFRWGVDMSGMRFIQGDVTETLIDPSKLPDSISILRLDTDWYESTRIELEVFYPRLASNGVLMIDDYGHWAGQKKAVDEYFAHTGIRPFLGSVAEGYRCSIKL